MNEPNKEIIDIINDTKKLYKLQQIIPEWVEFLEFVQDAKPKTIVEIGTGSGSSTICLAHFTECIISIDCYTQGSGIMKDMVKNICEAYFLKMDTSSKKCLKAVKKLLNGRKIDLLFIDGEHTYRGAKRDFYRFKPLVNDGGCIAIHDIAKSKKHVKLGCKVYKFWDKIKDEYESFAITSSDWGGIGVVKV
jgi:predicted O-methyltransferase YrrM